MHEEFLLEFVKDLYGHKVTRRFFEKMITVISYTVSNSQFSIFQKPTPRKPKRFLQNFLAHNSRYLMQNKMTPPKI